MLSLRSSRNRLPKWAGPRRRSKKSKRLRQRSSLLRLLRLEPFIPHLSNHRLRNQRRRSEKSRPRRRSITHRLLSLESSTLLPSNRQFIMPHHRQKWHQRSSMLRLSPGLSMPLTPKHRLRRLRPPINRSGHQAVKNMSPQKVSRRPRHSDAVCEASPLCPLPYGSLLALPSGVQLALPFVFFATFCSDSFCFTLETAWRFAGWRNFRFPIARNFRPFRSDSGRNLFRWACFRRTG